MRPTSLNRPIQSLWKIDLVFGLALLVLLGLGTWQVQRLSYKQELIQRLQERVHLPPLSLPQTVAHDKFLSLSDWEFQPVTLKGNYIADHEIRVMGRSLKGEEGVYIYHPFTVENPPITLLVQRGWVPFDAIVKDKWVDKLTADETELSGILRFDRGFSTIQKWVLPKPDLSKKLWYGLDIHSIAGIHHLDYPLFYLVIGDDEAAKLKRAQSGEAWPLPQAWRLDIPNDHAQYALTWYGMAIGLAVIWWVFRRQQRHRDDS